MDDRICSRILLFFCLLPFCGGAPCQAEEPVNAIGLYGAQLTSNNWEDFFSGETLRKQNSYLLALVLARRIDRYRDLACFEIEGQLVKHFSRQNHLELNGLATLRWEAFWWDQLLDTSLAFGLGLSYATDKPEVEIQNDGGTSRLLIYWMLELAFALPARPQLELLTRIHHRSNGFGHVAEAGGSNALALGLRYRF